MTESTMSESSMPKSSMPKSNMTKSSTAESSWHNSTCPHDCPSACALQVEKLGARRIGKVRGSSENPYTDGVICAKVSKYAERVHHPERLTAPLIRVSKKSAAARFEPIDWDSALDIVADKFKQVSTAFGAESVWAYYYGGTMGLVQQGGINRLVNALGYSRMQRTFCTQIAYDGWTAGTGKRVGSDPRELRRSELIVIWGCNAAATQINVMHHVARARKGGAKLIVIDPYQTPTAKIADLHIAPRPGTDGALACAIMQVLFENDAVDREYLAKYTNDSAALEAHLKTRNPAWAEQICGVPASQIQQFAEWYGGTQRSYIRLGIGFSRHRNGAVNVHAVSCLPALTGAWQVEGGGALLSTGGSFHVDETLIQGDDHPAPRGRILDMSQIGAILCGDKQALKGGAEVNAMLIQNTNPMLVAPDLGKVKRGLSRADLFVCVHEQFMTETTEYADIILPATTFVEHQDLYTSYGQTFLQSAKPVIEPLGQCRSNHQLICSLGKRLRADHRGFAMSSEQLIDETLEQSGYPPTQDFTEQHFIDCAPSFEEAHFINGFNWHDGKFRFAPNWRELGAAGGEMPTLPDFWDVIDARNAQHPLRLVAAPSRGFLNSSFNNTPSSLKREKFPQLKIHPQTAKRFAIVDKQSVKVGNDQGAVTVTAAFTEDIQADTVVVEGIWAAKYFPEGIGINLLISAEPAAPNGGAVFHDTAVWVKPAALP